MADGEHGVGTRTLRGMFWAYGSYVGGRLFVLLSVAILARLLSPSEFGLVAFALTVTALLDTVSDLGVSQALIVVRDPDETARKANTAWTLSVCLGAALTALTAALSPLAAAFFNEPELTALLSVLGLNFLLRAAGVTHFALAQKQIDFRTRTAAEVADVLVRGVVGVALALAGAGAWSLVIGYLAGSAAMTTTLWALVRWRPRIAIVRSDVRALLRFGGAITALDVLSAIIGNVDYVFVGRVLGEEPLGLYTLGYRLPELLVVNLAVVSGLVLFPAFAGIGRDALGDAFLTSLRYTLMIGVPLSVGLCVLAEPVTLAAFGGQWRGSVGVMRVLTIFAFCVTLGMPAGTAYKSLGRVDVLLKLGVPRAILAVAAIAIFAGRGIVAVAACQASVAALFAVVGITLAARLLGTGGRRIAVAALPAVCASVPLAAVLLLVERALDDPWLTLAAAVPLGAVAYIGALWLVAPDALRRLWRTAFPRVVSGGAGARAAPPPTP